LPICFKNEDQYVPIGKIADNGIINRIQSMFYRLNPDRDYGDIENWSILHLFSHLVFDLRVENDYFKGLSKIFRGSGLVSEDYLDYWWEKQKMVIDQYGALIEMPSRDRKSTRLNSSHVSISYAVFCLKKKRAEVV